MERKHGILVVGESLTDNAIRQYVLEEAGYSVVTVSSPAAAQEAMTHSCFAAAVVDGTLPPEVVLQLLVAIRASDISSLLIAPPGTAASLKALATTHISVENPFLLTEMVHSLVREQFRAKTEAVPLGLGQETVPQGEHLAWLCANDDDLARSVRFLEVGFEQGDTGIIFGDEKDNELFTRVLTADGFAVGELISADRLILIDAHSIITLGNSWVEKTRQILLETPSFARVTGSGSSRFPWASESVFLAYEDQIDAAIRGTRSVVACLYDLKYISGTQLLLGGLGKHTIVVAQDHVVRRHGFK